MSEITKLYKNAGIKAKWKDKRVKNTKTYYTEEQAKYLRQTTKNRNIQLLYPPFTAEKQLNLLQFCLKWGQVHILKGIDDEYRIENSCYRQGYQPTIADAIANYINEKWEKLTPEEQQQVKGILIGR